MKYMKRMPKEKVALYVYVSPKVKEKLDCLSQLYRSAGRKFSLGDVVEESVSVIYAAAYFCQNSKLWESFFRVAKILDTSDANNQGITDVLTIIQKNKDIAKKLLTVPVSLRENFMNEFNSIFASQKDKKVK
jgi:hypothetical protein